MSKELKKEVNIQKSDEDRKKEWMSEKIQVEFMNLEEPGVPLKFTYGTTQKKETYTLLHGGKYTLPRAVVQHIESRQTPIWKYRPDGSGSMKKNLESYKSRFQCREVFA
jgi:hypothetical protein